MNKPPDLKAADIVFGVELETVVPSNCGISVGNYHSGNLVHQGFRVAADPVQSMNYIAPEFNGLKWRSERDGSIVTPESFMSCEFVSPRLKGEAGILALSEFVCFANKINAKVNSSCGCHVTVSVPSVIGSHNAADIARFIRKLVRICNHHAWAIFAQTGTNRHISSYCRRLPDNAGAITNDLVVAERAGERDKRFPTVNHCGRGMVNLLKVFPSDMRESCVEFRAFAGTLNQFKVMHHVSTCLGLMRKAHVARTIPYFRSERHPADAPAALLRMWRHLGWVEDECCQDVALGLFGLHYQQFKKHSAVALKKAVKFEAKTPKANL